ncbi:integrase core domain-containing protein [Weissella minor]|uniref:integrase core domain-containing protein n=1 Tax=Weissella minor TaxID=1620 RepID=UPI003AF2742C
MNEFKIKHSYSLKGYPYDNGPIEAFHSILKREFVYLTKFKNYDDLILKIENYLYWYNHNRIRTAI